MITGCAHPGIVVVAEKAKEIAGGKIHSLLGGFHLSGASQPQVKYIADSLLQLGVEKVALCHCSGEGARKLFIDYFGHNHID